VIRQPEPKPSKVNIVDVIFCCSVLFFQPGLQMNSAISMSAYSSASIAENPMLAEVLFFCTYLVVFAIRVLNFSYDSYRNFVTVKYNVS
jgi:hypothetical protein